MIRWPLERCGDSFERTLSDAEELLLFRNCTPVTGTSNTEANRIFEATEEVNATIAASLESTNTVGFNVIITRSTGPNITLTVQPLSSITFIVDGVLTIDLFGFGGEYTAIFKEQTAYRVSV